jgi:hypothetical protein
VQGTSCICSSGQEGVPVGKYAWRCVKKDQQLAGPPTISCAGGTAKGTTCLCQRGQEAVKEHRICMHRRRNFPRITRCGRTINCAQRKQQGSKRTPHPLDHICRRVSSPTSSNEGEKRVTQSTRQDWRGASNFFAHWASHKLACRRSGRLRAGARAAPATAPFPWR